MITSRGAFRVKVGGSLRNGICNSCGMQMLKETIPFHDAEKIIMRCPKCGGMEGQLIARSIAIEAPDPPACTKFRCLWKFLLNTLLCGLVSSYHRGRVEYAIRNRDKKIPLKYRTGEDAPENIRQAIFAIIKLKLRR